MFETDLENYHEKTNSTHQENNEKQLTIGKGLLEMVFVTTIWRSFAEIGS